MQATLVVFGLLFTIMSTERNCFKRTQSVHLRVCIKTSKLPKISSQDCFPFNPALPNLQTLQSAIHASAELVHDFKTAKADGELKLKEFIGEVIYSKEKSLHDCIKRNSCLTFTKGLPNRTSEASKVTQAEMENKTLASVVNLVDVSGLISPADLVKYRITEECLTLFNVNASSRWTQKLVQQPIAVPFYTALVDMRMIWHLASPTIDDREKPNGSSYMWIDYTKKVISMLLVWHVDTSTIIWINDPYDRTESIKDDERELRIQGQGHIPNVYMKSTDKSSSIRDFKTFICNSRNKKRL